MTTQKKTSVNLENIKKHNTEVSNGLNSVSEGLVYFGHPLNISDEMLKLSQETVCCINHGAMLCIAKWDKGDLWRCPTCNEGAVLTSQNTQGVNSK